MTGTKNDQNPAISNADLASIRNAIKLNQEKQLKLTDLYLKNLLSEDTFKQKNEALRQEEEELRSKFAGLELLLIEKENSKDYLERVNKFLTKYDPEKKEFDAPAKKEILGLIFKKIMLKNLPRLRSAQAATGRIVPFWYAPFDKIISEPAMSAGREENLKICRRHHKNRAAISSKPMAVR